MTISVRKKFRAETLSFIHQMVEDERSKGKGPTDHVLYQLLADLAEDLQDAKAPGDCIAVAMGCAASMLRRFLDRMPAPAGYRPDGQPYWLPGQIAAHMEVSEEELWAQFNEKVANRPEPDPETPPMGPRRIS